MVRSIDRCILKPVVRALVASCDRAYDQSWHPKTDGTINRGVHRSIARSIVATYVRSYGQSWHQTIWNRRLDVLNKTIDLVTTDFALEITHDLDDQSYDLCDQSYVLSTICPRFQHFRSQVGRNLVVSPVWLGTFFLPFARFDILFPGHSHINFNILISSVCILFSSPLYWL